MGQQEAGDGGGGHLGHQAPQEVEAGHVDQVVGQLVVVEAGEVPPDSLGQPRRVPAQLPGPGQLQGGGVAVGGHCVSPPLPGHRGPSLGEYLMCET